MEWRGDVFGVVDVDEVSHHGDRTLHGFRVAALDAPAPIAALLAEYEELVAGQCFSLLDEMLDRIAEFGMVAQPAQGPGSSLLDLYVEAGGGHFQLSRTIRGCSP